MLGVAAAALTIAAAVTVPLLLDDDGDDSSDRVGRDVGATTAGVDLAEVEVFDDLEPSHSEDPVTYDQVPPAGGAHFPAWLECGVYDSPVPDEIAVHDLEHGTFWFAYDADALDTEQVQELADQLPDNGIMAPYPDLDAPVVVTVWGRQLALDGADDPRLPLFLEEFAGGTTAPEPAASCAGGLSAEEADAAVGIETF